VYRIVKKDTFVSKNIFVDIITNGDKSKFREIYESGRYNDDTKTTLVDVAGKMLYQELPTDISCVENDILDIEKFIKWRPIYRTSSFILEDKDGNSTTNREGGKYFCGNAIEKMSKSKFNVVTPDAIIDEYGADTLRLYEMFLGPLEQSKPWNTQGIEGVHRFLKKLWKLFYDTNGNLVVTGDEPDKKELKSVHKLIKKVGEDIEHFSFNTSVSSFMICVNELTDLKCAKKKILSDLLVCLSPYAPHIAEELWHAIGNTDSIVKTTFPVFNPVFLVEDTFSYPISINGKHRTNIEMGMEMAQPDVEQLVMTDDVVKKWLEGKQPKKIVFVKGRIVNVVV
jgi:leucyl-tRNA synthetase